MAMKDAATFIAELYESLKNPHVGEDSPRISSERFRIVSQFYVVGDTVGKLNDLEETIYESVRSGGFISRKAAEWLLHKAMTEAITIKDGLIGEREFQPALTKALAELKRCLRETPSDWEYWIRVVGFADEGFPSIFGQASFKMMNEADMNSLAGRLERAIDRTAMSDEQKEAMKPRTISSVQQKYFGHITATLTVSAVDSDAGADSALKVLRLTLDVLNFFISWDHPPTRSIRLLWEGGGIPEQFLAFKKTPPEESTLKEPLKGPTMAATVKPFENMPVFRRASELLAKQQPNAFEKRVLSALQWAGRASVQERPD